MIFNPWRKYPKRRPKESDNYLCTLENGSVVKLYFMVRDSKDIWIDPNRQSVFDGYKVYSQCRAAIEENRVWTDGLCKRTDEVVAWKKMPKAWRAGKGKKDDR